MPTIVNGKVQYAAGEALPTLGSQAYTQAQQGIITATPNFKMQQTPMDANIIGNTSALTIPQVNNTSAQTALGVATSIAAQPQNTQIIQPEIPVLSETQSIKDKIASLIGLQAEEGQRTLDLQDEQDLEQKQQAVNDINKKITTTKKAYEDQIQEMRKNSEGKFAGAVEADIANLTRTANEDLANLAIIQASASGDLDTANNIIDTKIKAEFEPLQNQIESYTQLFNLVQDDLTESEKLIVQDQIDAKNAGMQELMSAKEYAYKTAVEYGASESVLKSIGSATTADQAYGAIQGVVPQQVTTSGSSGNSGTSPINNVLAQQPEYTNVAETDVGMVKLLNQYKNFLNSHSAFEIFTNPTLKAGKSGLVSQITAEYKKAKTLGTLDAGVQKLIDGLIGNVGLAKYSNKAQSSAVSQLLANLGYQANTTSKAYTPGTSGTLSSGITFTVQ